MYHLYILRCADNTLYTGIAVDVAKRVAEHNQSPRGARYTRSRRPVKLAFMKAFRSRAKALREEYRIKQLTRQEKLLLIRNYKKLA
ncbi:MAG: GIY-YIG nuclease family protein [Patescibacteria group bacterium]